MITDTETTDTVVMVDTVITDTVITADTVIIGRRGFIVDHQHHGLDRPESEPDRNN